MRILAFTSGGSDQPSSHYRAYLLGLYLREQYPAIRLDIAEPSTKEISALAFTQQISSILREAKLIFFGGYDLIFIQRAIYNKFIFLLLWFNNLFGKTLAVFDIDDSVFLHSPIKTRLLARTSGACIGGSHYVCAYLRKHNPNVRYIPTVIKMSDYALATERSYQNQIPVIGWIGYGPGYLPELREFVPLLSQLREEGYQFKLLFIGLIGSEQVRKLFDSFPSDMCELIDYVPAKTDADLVSYFMRMDIGVMPIAHDEWSRGKCSFKAIQYMAAGMPVVASRWGENEIVIEDGSSGLLAETPHEWKNAVAKLIKDASLRERLGQAARERVAAQYSYESQLISYINLFNELCAKKRSLRL